MAQQKLYTEEQVRQAMQEARYAFNTDKDYDEILKSLPPIEIPSDEVINKKAYDWCRVEDDENGFIRAGDDYDIKELPSFIGGAKWMKEQILGKEDKTFKQKSKWTEVDNMTRRLK